MELTCYMQIRPIQRASPHPSLPLSFHFSTPNRMAAVIADPRWGLKVLMYSNHIVEKIVFYNTSQSNEPKIYNGPFYLHRVVQGNGEKKSIQKAGSHRPEISKSLDNG